MLSPLSSCSFPTVFKPVWKRAVKKIGVYIEGLEIASDSYESNLLKTSFTLHIKIGVYELTHKKEKEWASTVARHSFLSWAGLHSRHIILSRVIGVRRRRCCKAAPFSPPCIPVVKAPWHKARHTPVAWWLPRIVATIRDLCSFPT